MRLRECNFLSFIPSALLADWQDRIRSMAHATNTKICKCGDDVIAVAMLLLRMRLLISIQIRWRPAGCRREDKSSLPPLTYSAFSFRRLEVERIVQTAVVSLSRSKSF